MSRFALIDVSELEPGEMRKVEVGGRTLCVANVEVLAQLH